MYKDLYIYNSTIAMITIIMTIHRITYLQFVEDDHIIFRETSIKPNAKQHCLQHKIHLSQVCPLSYPQP